MIEDDADEEEIVIPAGAAEANPPGVDEPEEDQPRLKRRRVTTGGEE